MTIEQKDKREKGLKKFREILEYHCGFNRSTNDLVEIHQELENYFAPKIGKTKTIEYKAGYDAGFNGANTVNCDFRLFATPKQTKEWERGNKDGLKVKT